MDSKKEKIASLIQELLPKIIDDILYLALEKTGNPTMAAYVLAVAAGTSTAFADSLPEASNHLLRVHYFRTLFEMEKLTREQYDAIEIELEKELSDLSQKMLSVVEALDTVIPKNDPNLN